MERNLPTESERMEDMPSQEDELEEFQNYMRKKNMAEHTVSAYTAAVVQYYRGHRELTLPDLKLYRSFLMKNYRPATINQRVYAINCYLQYLADCHPEELSLPNTYRLASVKIPRGSFRDSVISNEDCRILEEGLRRDHNDYWYFVVRFLVTTGARVSELTQIKVEHLNCGFLDLYSKGGKIRRIYLADSLCREALGWCRARGQVSGFLFPGKNGRPVTARGIHSQLKVFALRYGIDSDTTYPHSFRHRFAINFLARSGDIALLADLLGHESIETTRIYLTRSSQEQKELLDELVTW